MKILGFKRVDHDPRIVSGNADNPGGLFHYVFSYKNSDGPFLGVTLKLPTYYTVESVDFDPVYNGEENPEDPEGYVKWTCMGVTPLFAVMDAEGILYHWKPVHHKNFDGLELNDILDEGYGLGYKPDVFMLVRQMTTEEYETLLEFDRAGPRDEWMEVEVFEWREGPK